MGHQFPLVQVKGSAHEMGRQHGEQAGPLVRKYLLWIERLTGRPRRLLCQNAERFLPMLQRLSPKFVEEVQGLSEGAGISLPEALLCQVRAEASHTWDGGCTAFALKGEATADGEVLIGQNQEMEPEFADVATQARKAIIAPHGGGVRITRTNKSLIVTAAALRLLDLFPIDALSEAVRRFQPRFADENLPVIEASAALLPE